MHQKKILILCNHFYPHLSPRSFRATQLAKEFARTGHDVTVLTFKDEKHHPEFERNYNIKIQDLGSRKFKPVQIKGKGLVNLFWRALSRFQKLIFEYPDIELSWMTNKKLKKINGFYDLLISIAVPYPLHWGVAYARTRAKFPAKIWVADCGDPYMGVENDSFKKPFYFKYIEKWFCRSTDFITVPTQGAISGYYPEFRNKVRVIPQGFNFDNIRIYQGPRFNKIRTFGYAGSFIPGRRDPTEFIDYLLGQHEEFKFHIFTNSAYLLKENHLRASDKIQIHGYIPREELLYELSKMDFVVNFENIGSKQTPSKLIDYAILNKPILSVKTGNLQKDVINEFLKGNYQKSFRINDIDQYRIENVCSEFLQLLNPQ